MVTGKPELARVIPEIDQPSRQRFARPWSLKEALERQLVLIGRHQVVRQIPGRKRARAPKLNGLIGSEMLDA